MAHYHIFIFFSDVQPKYVEAGHSLLLECSFNDGKPIFVCNWWNKTGRIFHTAWDLDRLSSKMDDGAHM